MFITFRTDLNYFLVFVQLGNFTSTKGYVFTKAIENFDCCVTGSISSSKRENQDGEPLIYTWSNGNLACNGGSPKSFQAWMDAAADDIYKGLCIDGWLYVAEGI